MRRSGRQKHSHLIPLSVALTERTVKATREQLTEAVYTVVDVETTGGKPPLHKIIEIAGVRVERGVITGNYHSLVNPGRYIPPFVAEMTGIHEELVSAMPAAEEVMVGFLGFLGDSVFVAHNAAFDLMFLNHELQNMGMDAVGNLVLCTQKLAKRLVPEMERRSLDALAARLGIPIEGRHRALGDATATARMLIAFLGKAVNIGVKTVDELLHLQNSGPDRDLSGLKEEWPVGGRVSGGLDGKDPPKL